MNIQSMRLLRSERPSDADCSITWKVSHLKYNYVKDSVQFNFHLYRIQQKEKTGGWPDQMSQANNCSLNNHKIREIINDLWKNKVLIQELDPSRGLKNCDWDNRFTNALEPILKIFLNKILTIKLMKVTFILKTTLTVY